jgi:stage II sporulation protein D
LIQDPLDHKRPPLLPGAAFAFGALLGIAAAMLGGCASVQAGLDKPGTVEMQVGSAPVEQQGAAEKPASGGPQLRVLLRRGQQGLKLSAPGGLSLRDSETHAALTDVGASVRGRLEAHGDTLYLGDKALAQEVEVVSLGEAIKVAGRSYAGRILLRASGSQVYLINEISLEGYLKGVLPSEVPANWPLEALKAQAVAARSYAAWRASATRQAGPSAFDLDDSVASQAYQGLEKQDPRTDRAVDACAGEILSYRGKIAECFFHSNSGGHTAGADEAWGGEAPAYLAGVLDSWSEDQQHYAWSGSLSAAQVEARLTRAGLWPGGIIDEIAPRDASESGRWTQVRLIGGSVDKTVKAAAFRTALGADLLRSTHFKIHRRGDDWAFDGLGWGHGVGLAQEGAKAQAEAGRNYRAILDFYYPGTHWSRLR